MNITIKFFASLRDRFNIDTQNQVIGASSTVMDVWNQATENKPMPVNVLVAVNADYVGQDHVVKEGDEVAFFPPVTGG